MITYFNALMVLLHGLFPLYKTMCFSIPGPPVPWKKDVLRHKFSTFNYVSGGGGFETSFPAYLWLHHDPIISGFWSWLFKSGALAW